MNVSPINPYLARGLERTAMPAGAAPRPSAPTSSPDSEGAVRTRLSAEAPQGTDERLWSVLSEYERSHFSRSRGAADLTYGPAGSSRSLSLRGQALNVRV